jgi:hypothetical protein
MLDSDSLEGKNILEEEIMRGLETEQWVLISCIVGNRSSRRNKVRDRVESRFGYISREGY